uniref:NADH-ubiquinone oxidoreductase chain 3 n=1 Tax=Cryptophyllium westwoodii TaxID=2778107 RepID=A0A7T8IMD6_9NEOP|nr:NADH dehydrogenase subunit 3 [Cryptophyllium westwoodii]
MNMSMMLCMMMMMMTNTIMMMNMIMSKKAMKDREKCSPIECGFNPKSSPRMPFSLKFFLIAVIFLIFDIEIALILPMVPSIKLTKPSEWSITSMMFLIILMLGLYYEWNQGALNWAK